MRIKCEVCGEYGYIQKLGNYYRVRHYSSEAREKGKYSFYYHKQTVGYAEEQLKALEPKDVCSSNLEHKGKSSVQEARILKPNSSIKSKKKSGCSLVWLGHQPATLTTRVRIPATAPLSHIYSCKLQVFIRLFV
jgi:hypothetical protein